MPKGIAASALVVGDEVAWNQHDRSAAIEWLRDRGYAIVGTELWIPEGEGIRTVFATPEGPAIYVTSCDPLEGESWNDFIRRSSATADAAIGTFRLDENSADAETDVFFNLAWADLDWFRSRG